MASYRALITATTEALAGSNGSIALNNVKNTHKFFANGATKTEARAVLKEAPASEFYQTLGMGIGLGTVFGAAYLVKIEMLKAKDREYEAAFMKAQELKRYEDRKEYSKHVAYFKGVVSAMKADQSE